VQEFRNEGNNEASTTLTLTPGTPPDLQVAEVEAPASVLAGQAADHRGWRSTRR
jgi:hypothetical protein